jgi:four helix bundle protein
VDEIVDVVGRVHRLAREVGRHDGDLGKQLRTAATSLGLNAGEGAFARGGKRTNQLDTAMCSGREAILALRIAGAAGYLGAEVVATEADAIDKIVATLHKLTYPRR